jgi:ribonuclease HI
MADWTPSQNQSNNKKQPYWNIYYDEAWGFAGAGAAAIITSPLEVKMKYTVRLEFQCTNNIAEYEVVLLRLRKAKAIGIQGLIIKTDSYVVARHIEKDYKARDQELAKYLQFLREQEKYFEGFTVKNISITDNSDADEIAKAAAQNTSFPQDVFFQVLTHASIKTKQEVPREVHIIQSEDRRAPIMAYLRGH